MMVPPVILAPGRCGQERHELEASLGYIVKLSWGEKTKTHRYLKSLVLRFLKTIPNSLFTISCSSNLKIISFIKVGLLHYYFHSQFTGFSNSLFIRNWNFTLFQFLKPIFHLWNFLICFVLRILGVRPINMIKPWTTRPGRGRPYFFSLTLSRTYVLLNV